MGDVESDEEFNKEMEANLGKKEAGAGKTATKIATAYGGAAGAHKLSKSDT